MVIAPRTILTADFLAIAMLIPHLFVLVAVIAVPLDARNRHLVRELHYFYMLKSDCQERYIYEWG